MSRKKTRHLNAAKQARLAFRRGDFNATQRWTKLAEQQARDAAQQAPPATLPDTRPLGDDGSPLLTEEQRKAALDPINRILRRLGCETVAWIERPIAETWKLGDPLPEGTVVTTSEWVEEDGYLICRPCLSLPDPPS